MKITVASGKGGTGKTTVATNLALSMCEAQLIDCDVEEPDSHLFLDVELEKLEDVCLKVPRIDLDKCTFCGKCSEFCQYHTLAVVEPNVLTFPELCHGCGGCTLVCPEGAITEEDRSIGVIERGETGGLEFFHGLLNIGEPMATPVIRALKRNAGSDKTVIFDAPPGNACPVIETVQGSDYCLLVTEPTPFGLHDLKLAVNVLRKIGVPFGVIINRDGVGDGRVEDYCKEERISILMYIPHRIEIAELYSRGIPFCLEMPEWKVKFNNLYERIRGEVGR